MSVDWRIHDHDDGDEPLVYVLLAFLLVTSAAIGLIVVFFRVVR